MTSRSNFEVIIEQRWKDTQYPKVWAKSVEPVKSYGDIKKTMEMTSFDLENDLEVKFWGHFRKALLQLHNTPKFEQNRRNWFWGITIFQSMPKSEKKKKEKKEKKEKEKIYLS